MQVSEFIEKIENGDAHVLTVEAAKAIKGKKIAWMYFGDRANRLVVEEMVVGDIMSKLDYYENEPCDGYKSRSDYWRSYMTAKQLNEVADTLILLNVDGKDSCIYNHNVGFFNEPTFTCSDADREVYYIEL